MATFLAKLGNFFGPKAMGGKPCDVSLCCWTFRESTYLLSAVNRCGREQDSAPKWSKSSSLTEWDVNVKVDLLVTKISHYILLAASVTYLHLTHPL